MNKEKTTQENSQQNYFQIISDYLITIIIEGS